MPFRSLTSAPLGSIALSSSSLLAGFWLLACDNDYPIAPTECDDWCYATQRADCEEDESPDDCVSNCEENALGRQHPACEPEWIRLSECYRDAPDSAFTCVQDYSEPSNSLCLDERRAAHYCVSELAGSCFDRCVREVETCGGTLADCEQHCSGTTEGCETEQLDFERCLVQAPVVCSSGGSLAEPACCEPLVALLRCAGYDGENCPEG